MCVHLCLFKPKDCWKNFKSDLSTPFSWILSFYSPRRYLQLLLLLLFVFLCMVLVGFKSGRGRLVCSKGSVRRSSFITGSMLCLMPWLWVIQVQCTHPELWLMQAGQMGSLSSPCWWEFLFHGWAVCCAHRGTALKLLGSVVVNYLASSGWKLPWGSSSRSVWCLANVEGGSMRVWV